LSGGILAKALYPMDKALFKVTGGRATVPGLIAGLPVLMLATTGARSGLTKVMPLIGIPIENNLAIIGTNYGQQLTPGWVFNLEANPAATVAYRDKTVPVTARRADHQETERAFDRAADLFPGYATYRLRAQHRVIRVFVLESATGGESSPSQ